MRSIRQAKNLKGKKVLVRVDFNVPVKDDVVLDSFRIKKSIPTIKFLKAKGAKIILISHLGKGGESLAPVAEVLNKFIKVKFVPEVLGNAVLDSVAKLRNGEVLLLENLRNNKGEKGCDKNFARSLADLADVYVNESFAVDHRRDASLVLVPKLLPSYAGFQLEEEVKNLSKVMKSPKHPFLFILGGAKFSTKMPLVKKYLKSADYVFLGGALANDFMVVQGYEVGQSLVDSKSYGIEKLLKNKKLILPIDVLVNSHSVVMAKKVNKVSKEDTIIDIGPDSIKMLAAYIKKAKLILWNGPLGKYEDGGAEGTKSVLRLVAKSRAESIMGGGDTVALISEMKIEKKISFISTGGGATLDFLAHGTLPGIKALE